MNPDPIAQVAERHGFSAEAARALFQALQSTGGNLAQFSHPELGGYGQWMPGMIMIGDMFNHSLKSRVSALCNDLAALVVGGGASMPSPSPSPAPGAGPVESSRTMEPMKPMEPLKPMEPMKPMEPWWPRELGQPNSAGSQNDLRYAYFAGSRRLAVSRGGAVTVYDTADHSIGGVSQQQGGSRGDVTFTSQHGPVALSDLKVVGS